MEYVAIQLPLSVCPFTMTNESTFLIEGKMKCKANIRNATISASVFRGNYAQRFGGGMHIEDSRGVVKGCLYAANEADETVPSLDLH